MNVLVIGARGQLGSDICKAFSDVTVHEANSDRVNIMDRDSVHKLIVDELKPDVVVNTAAFHNVPKCEEEPENAFMGNGAACQYLGAACEEVGARIIHISTDYVFGHGGSKPYIETDATAPLSIYGATKLAGEHLLAAECANHIILRVAAIYGVNPCRAKGGHNFVDLMLKLAKERGEVKVVTDEITTPTHTASIAKQVRVLAEQGEPGVYHGTCQGSCSWHEFAKTIFEETNTEVTLHETTSDSFPSPVKRPSYSVLENKHSQDQGIDIMPDWREGLDDYLKAKGLKG